MKILHIIQFLGIGGLERVVLSLAQWQQEQGHQVSVYVYDHEQSWVDHFRDQGIEVIIPQELKKSGYDLGLLAKFSQVTASYDIIHSHDLNPMMYFGPLHIFKRLLRKRKQAYIHSTHGMDHLENYPRAKTFEKIFSRLPDKIICVSQHVENFYRDEVGLGKNKVERIDNGVRTFKGEITPSMRQQAKEWVCERHGLNPQLPLLTSLARVVPLKDQAFLMRQLAKHQWQLLIVGPVEEGYAKEVSSLASDRIVLAGPQSEVERYNLASDLYLSASTHEGIPVAVLEALALETPSLVSDIAGHTILNSHGELVRTYKIGCEQSFEEELLALMNDLPHHQESAKVARTLVEEHYSLEAMARRVAQIYEETLC